LLNAKIRPGIELILELVDFDRRIVGADLVVTGEGSLDDQSLAGKAPVGVARAAARSGVPVVAVAGRLQLSPQQLRRAGIEAAYALTDLEPDLNQCIANASPLLRQLGAHVAKEWLAKLPRS
jgi:glycerate kinase